MLYFFAYIGSSYEYLIWCTRYNMIWLCMHGYSFLCFVYSNVNIPVMAGVWGMVPDELLSSLLMSYPVTWPLPCMANILTTSCINTRMLTLFMSGSSASLVQALAHVVQWVRPFFGRLFVAFLFFELEGGWIRTVTFLSLWHHLWLKKN